MQVRRPRPAPITERITNWVEAQRQRAPAPVIWWLIVLGLGIATMAWSLVLQNSFPTDAANMAPGYGVPVIAFEFAQTAGDLVAIFGDSSDPAQGARLMAMQNGNEQDYLFMLLYASFLSTGCWALWRELRLPILLLGVLMPVLAALFDAWENWLLFEIQVAFTVGEYSPAISSLPAPVAAKFLLLTMTNVLIGYALSLIPGRGWQLAGVLVIVPCVTTLMALIAPSAFGWTLSAAIAAGWFALLITAGIASWRAIVGKKPLVNFTDEALRSLGLRPTRRSETADEIDEGPATPMRPATFGRRRNEGSDETE